LPAQNQYHYRRHVSKEDVQIGFDLWLFNLSPVQALNAFLTIVPFKNVSTFGNSQKLKEPYIAHETSLFL
jgi:hypothetical protein